MRNFHSAQTKSDAKFDLLMEKVQFHSEILNNVTYLLKIVSFQIENLNYELTVDHKVIDIDSYLPFKTVSDILHFCSPADGLLDLKKAALRKRIFAKGKIDDVSSFAPSIVDAFFEGSPLLGTHKWPFKK